MKRRTGLPAMALVFAAGLGVSLCPGAASNQEATKRERAMDRVVHIEEGIIREVPSVPRLCDGLNLRKEKVDVGDCKLYCEQEGQGTPLVLLHGGPGATHHNFHPRLSQAKDFARVIYYDQRGCGLSDYQPGNGYSVDQAADDLDRLRQVLGIDQWVVLGHSYGGLLAQYYATKHPEDLKGLVLLCASTGLRVESLPSREYQFISREEQEKMNQIRRTPGLSMAQIVYNNHLNGDWKRQNYYRPTREQIAQGALYGWVHDLDPDFNGAMSRSQNGVDLEGAFARCPIPTLILEGKWDMSWNTDKPEQFRKNHPNAKLVLFEASAHSPFKDEPEAFFAVLKDFLGGLPQVPGAKIDSWKRDLAQWRESKRDPLLAEKIIPAEAQAIEEFRRLKARIRAGEHYEDASTPLQAVLTQMSKWRQQRDQDDFMDQDIFRAPLPPEKPKEGTLWPIFAGSNELQDTFIVVYTKGRWLWVGNCGAAGDWRPARPFFESSAQRAMERQAAQDKTTSAADLLAGLGWGRNSNEKIATAYNPQWLDQIDDPWLLLKAGFALYDARRYQEALALFEMMSERAGGDPRGQAVALIWQGHMLDLLNRRDEAVTRYRKAAGLDVQGGQRHDQYGLAYEPSTYVKQRMDSPFVRLENLMAD